MPRKFVDVGSFRKYPGNVLTNFAAHQFEFQGKLCKSMEGLLQAHKFEAEKEQRAACLLVGKEAKAHGRHRNKIWQEKQQLWWVDARKSFPRHNTVFDRDSAAYIEHLKEVYFALFSQSQEFQTALKETGAVPLKHSIGHEDKTKTILTSSEFIFLLNWLRFDVMLVERRPTDAPQEEEAINV